MIAKLASLHRDRSGSVAPLIAVLATALIGTAAFAVDVGRYYAERKALQSATEAASLSAAMAPYDAANRARDYMVRNGYAASTVESVEIGRYCPDSSLEPTERFYPSTTANPCPGNGRPTAVRIRAKKPTTRFLSAVFGGTLLPDMTAVATAARIDEAGLQVTSNPLTLSPGLLNGLLAALTGINVSLTSYQLQTLMSGNIDVGVLLDRLAARTNHKGTYGTILDNPVPFSTVLAAAADAANAYGNTQLGAAFSYLAANAGGTTVNLKGLIELGVWEKMPVGDTTNPTGLRAGLNAYQLIAYALQNHGRPANVSGLHIGVAGIASVDLVGTATGTLSRARFAFGPAGETSAHTAVTRILLAVRIGQIGSLIGLPLLDELGVEIPLLLEIGAGSAQITDISCGSEAATDTRVTVQAESGFLSAYIGKPPADVLTLPFRQLKPSDFQPVTLVNLLLLELRLKAVVGPVLGSGVRTLQFSRQTNGPGLIGDPLTGSGGTAIRVGSGSNLGPLLTSLGQNLTLDLQILSPLIVLPLGQLVGLLTPLLSGVITVLGVDPLLTTLLAVLGVQPGYVDTWVTGVRCGVPVLV